jgi:uncharacterized protein
MEFEWDEEKDAQNRAKHGIGLGEAMRMDWVVGTTVVDERLDYGEERLRRYAFWNGRLFMCAFTMREAKVRVISFRKANRREVRRYGTPRGPR